jgi:glycosyltransferase involved in cell wall biosynthesis
MSRAKTQVVVVNQHFPPLPGGGSLRVDGIATGLHALAEDGVPLAVTVLTGSIPDAPTRPYTLLTVLGKPVASDRSLLRRLTGELAMGCRTIWKLLRLRPDLLVISIPSYFMALLIVAYAQLLRIPYVIDLRDIYPEMYADAGLMSETSSVYRLALSLSRRMYVRARLVVAATKGLKECVAVLSGRKDVAVSYNGYPDFLNSIQPNKAERFTICFHGVMGFFQDIEGLLEVARLLEEFAVDVLVIGYGRKEPLVRELAPSNLRFLGRLPLKETLNAVATAHVGICTRTDDRNSKNAFPIKVFEYIGVGIPIIVWPPCEAGAFVEDNDCGSQFAADDRSGIVAEILKLRDDSAYYHQKADAARRAAVGLSRGQLGLEYARLLQGLL